jgi:large subunit ribosomal protein L29
MKTRELRPLTDDQLADHLRDAAKEMFQLRFRSATEKLNAPSQLRELRRRIARIKTLQREREIARSSEAK